MKVLAVLSLSCGSWFCLPAADSPAASNLPDDQLQITCLTDEAYEVGGELHVTAEFKNVGGRSIYFVMAGYYSGIEFKLWSPEGKEIEPTEAGRQYLKEERNAKRWFMEELKPGETISLVCYLGGLFDFTSAGRYRCQISRKGYLAKFEPKEIFSAERGKWYHGTPFEISVMEKGKLPEALRAPKLKEPSR